MITIKMQDGDFIRTTGDKFSWETVPSTDYKDAIMQRLRHRLKLFKEEWFFDTSQGIDWFGLMEKPFSINFLYQEISEAILLDDEIESIESLNIDPDFSKRSLTVSFEVKMMDESIIISEELS